MADIAGIAMEKYKESPGIGIFHIIDLKPDMIFGGDKNFFNTRGKFFRGYNVLGIRIKRKLIDNAAAACQDDQAAGQKSGLDE